MSTRTQRRHWKQSWDPKAEFVFMKRLRMGDNPDKPFVFPGDPVTAEMRAKMGPARLRRWWEAQVIGLADFDPTTRSRKIESLEKVIEVHDEALADLNDTHEEVLEQLSDDPVVAKKGGWYTVTFPDGEVAKCRKADLESTLERRVNAPCNPED